VETGLCFLRHTSASLLIQKRSGCTQRSSQLYGKTGATQYIHSAEGLDDMPAHIRTAHHTSEQIHPQGQLVLGTWQESTFGNTGSAVTLEIVVHIVGETSRG